VTKLTRIKLLVAAAGVSVWGLGVRLGDDRLRWVGIVLLAAAVLLRLVRDKEIRPADGNGAGKGKEDETD